MRVFHILGLRAMGSVAALAFALALVAGSGCYRHHGDEGDDYRYGGGYGGSPGPAPGDAASGFSLAWKLVDGRLTGDPLVLPAMACADGHIANVRLGALNQDTAQQWSWTFGCEAGSGLTPDVTLGHYTIAVDALDASGVSKSRDSWSFDNEPTGNLGLVIFQVIP